MNKTKRLRTKTEQESLVYSVIRSRRLPFRFTCGKRSVGKCSPHFMANDKKVILEVFDPNACGWERWKRVKGFEKEGYCVLYLHREIFSRPDVREYLAGTISGFYNRYA